MAKKTENKQNEQAVTPAVQEDKAVTAGNVPEKADRVPERTENVPESEPAPETAQSMKRMEEILNNDAGLREDFTETLDKDTDRGQPEPEEKILFYVKTVNDKTAVRSAPEYPMGSPNVIDIITDRGPYGIVDVENGFGRIAGGAGWIMLDSSVVIRQG